MGTRAWVSQIDAFRSVPKDLAEASTAGAVMTVVAMVVCVVLFVSELSAFLTSTSRSDIVIDSNQDAELQINFDVTMLDMACEFVTVGVWDAFGTDRMNITKNIKKQRISHTGSFKGAPYTEDELVELEFSNMNITAEELSELDSDWSSSSDQFKHDSFQSVIDAHDFTFVNFYAGWCPHCRQFAPTWDAFEKSVNEGEEAMIDADGSKAQVRVLKINCVDFEETCQEQRVQAFPSIRFYKRGSTAGTKDRQWVDYQGPRAKDGLVTFAKGEVRKRHMHTGARYHEIFGEGCRIYGFVEVARVPGTVHFQAMQYSQDKTLNLAFTNVSHRVEHFSFGSADKSVAKLPSEYRKSATPLDGRTFAVDKFHMAPHHYIKVVHTRFEAKNARSYQQTHQWSVRTVPRKTVPQAKFSYDLSPVEVVVRKAERRWYDFVTSVFAILGGTVTIMSMASGAFNIASKQFKGSINKLG
mmetsp:Transcript_20304/g.36885  ORF Transcript_20304/g.36885 Transcript_20304/m.36885 type:complete len:469 (+) Transcript_20304:63-1469(+)